MRVRYLKNHLTNKLGDEENVDDGLANYWFRVGVAEEAKEAEEESNSLRTLRELNEKKVISPDKEKVEIKPFKEKKETAGLPTAKKKKK